MHSLGDRNVQARALRLEKGMALIVSNQDEDIASQRHNIGDAGESFGKRGVFASISGAADEKQPRGVICMAGDCVQEIRRKFL